MLKYPDGTSYPVMLRYFWEFNLNATSQLDDAVNGNGGCFVYGNNAPVLTTQFINAWVHIWNVMSTTFEKATPRPNVSFAWNPHVAPAVDPNGIALLGSTGFYPGPSYVDWIGLDGYSEELKNSPFTPQTFAQRFTPDYTTYTTNPGLYGTKPIMVGETAACGQYSSPYDQATYIGALQSGIESGSPAPFAKIAAVNYFDTHGSYQPPDGTRCGWTFTPTGVNAFVSLGMDPYFLPMIKE